MTKYVWIKEGISLAADQRYWRQFLVICKDCLKGGKKNAFMTGCQIIGTTKNARDPYMARYVGPRTQTEES